ncbi:hypothetical protein Vafri_7237 [Volvox africanus]|uniref:Uncharacterized protein n=1 Tax=Volvox africanus TaxID=51714 RepID=A0A8J4B4C9_9CHLO|nr:hypothetical protein Vafri_7237 [Volvox africanus]
MERRLEMRPALSNCPSMEYSCGFATSLSIWQAHVQELLKVYGRERPIDVISTHSRAYNLNVNASPNRMYITYRRDAPFIRSNCSFLELPLALWRRVARTEAVVHHLQRHVRVGTSAQWIPRRPEMELSPTKRSPEVTAILER